MTTDDENAEKAKHSADQVKRGVVGPAAADARDTGAHRRMYLTAAFILAGIFGLVALGAIEYNHVAALQQQVAQLQDQGNRNQVVAEKLATQVRSLGGTPTVLPSPVSGSPGPQGVAGPAGAPGSAGRGITSTSLTGGHLIVAYTDGTSTDVGTVAGPAGATGASGAAGRSITSTSLTNGHLVVAYSDSTSSDVGAVVGKDGANGQDGKAGRGVTSVTINTDSHLIVTYTDGTNSDAGQIPTGPAGPAGQPGASGAPGAKGDKGDPGTPGPACPSGTHLANVLFANGASGRGCVYDSQPAAALPTR